MALKDCKECGKEVSTKADLCPHCGARQKRKSIGCGGALLILFAIGFFGSQISTCSREAEEGKRKVQINEQREKTRKQEFEKYVNDKKDFMGKIDTHYEELIKFVEQKQFDSALEKFSLFEKFQENNYKELDKYSKTIKSQSALERLKKIPSTDTSANLAAYVELVALDPGNKSYKDKFYYYQKKSEQEQKKNEEKNYRASCQLEYSSGGWSEDYGYATYEGKVKNVSNSKLENVEAVVTWYDKDGDMITSSSSLIQYNPILPGQSSPFKVMKTYNPAMEKAGVEFSHLMGGTIRSYKK